MAGFGTGLGLQGTPPLHGQYFNQRQQQEEARKNAKIKRDDDAYQKILEGVSVKPGEYDWKVETKAREAVADFTYQVDKLKAEFPDTWENKVRQLAVDTNGKLQGYRSDSVALKSIREAKKTGKYYVPESAGKYLDTDQGNMKGGLPGLVDQKLFGFVVDQETGHLGYNPVEKKNLQGEFEKHITSREKAYQFEMDPATGQPKVNIIKGTDGATRQYTKRMLPPDQVDDLYAGITLDPHLAQNINIAYAEELKKRPDYNEAMIVTPDGNWNPEFLKGATKYGRDLAGNMARNYFTTENLSAPAKTVVNNNINTGSTKIGGGISAITPSTFKIGVKTGKMIPSTDGKTQVPEYGDADVTTEGQFTRSNFKVIGANTKTVHDMLTGEDIEGPGVVNAEYAPFAVVPVFKVGPDKGKVVPDKYQRGQGANKPRSEHTIKSAIDNDQVEWKVVSIGTYQEPGFGAYMQPISVERSIYRDANEVESSASTGLSETDEPDFNRKLNQQYAFAKAKNEGFRGTFKEFEEGKTAPKTGSSSKPPKIQGF